MNVEEHERCLAIACGIIFFCLFAIGLLYLDNKNLRAANHALKEFANNCSPKSP